MMSHGYVTLSSGSNMPLLGYGTGGVSRITEYDPMYNCLDTALSCGYRLIDTAQLYKNEASIGRCLKELLPKHNLEREDIFITSKLQLQNMYPDKIRPSVEKSLVDLQTDYLDLFLVHYSAPDLTNVKDPRNKEIRKACWLELEKLCASGKLRSIGICSYELRHLDEMATYATIQPSVFQGEFHPHFCRRDFFNEIRRRNIHYQAFSSLGRRMPSPLWSEPLLVELAGKYKVPVSHILLAWPMAQGIGVIPKSTKPENIRDNYQAVNVELSEDDIERIWTLNKNMIYDDFCAPWEVL